MRLFQQGMSEILQIALGFKGAYSEKKKNKNP